MTHTPGITRPPREVIEALKRHRRRDRRRHARPHGHPQPAHAGAGQLEPGQVGRRPGGDAAVHAEARGPLRRGRIHRPREAAPPPRALPRRGGRRRRRRRPRRHDGRRLRRHDVDLLQGPRRRRHGDRRLPARLSQPEAARPAALDPRLDAELPHPDRPDALRRQRADRLRRGHGHPRRHHRRGRRRRGRPAGRACRRR